MQRELKFKYNIHHSPVSQLGRIIFNANCKYPKCDHYFMGFTRKDLEQHIINHIISEPITKFYDIRIVEK